MSLLHGGARISLLYKGVDERQVVRLDGKRCPFEKMSEVTYSGIHCEKFLTEGVVSIFHRGELPAEKMQAVAWHHVGLIQGPRRW